MRDHAGLGVQARTGRAWMLDDGDMVVRVRTELRV